MSLDRLLRVLLAAAEITGLAAELLRAARDLLAQETRRAPR